MVMADQKHDRDPRRLRSRLKLDLAVSGQPVSVVRTTEKAEISGFNRVMAPEITHNPFMPLAAAAITTRSIELATGVAVAFARTPMSLAYEGWGLQVMSGGRAVVGVGSQVKPHIERRFGMPWSAPVDRMREYIRAVRAIWSCWRDGEELDFRGEFYSHTFMPLMFCPEFEQDGLEPPPLMLAGVGPRMTRLAGEMADGLFLHPLSTDAYLRSEVLPGVEEAHAAMIKTQNSGKASQFELIASVLVATGETRDEIEEAKEDLRRRLAFYGSTPAYREVFDYHGWESVHHRLHSMSRQGRWDKMAELIDDDICHAIGAVGTPDEIAEVITARFDGVVDRVALYDPNDDPGQSLLDVVKLSVD